MTNPYDPGGMVTGRDENTLNKLFDRDATIWSRDPQVMASISQRLGWLDAVAFCRNELPRLRSFADSINDQGFTCAVLLGMGGSSLAPEVLNTCFSSSNAKMEMIVLDTTFPDSIVRTTTLAEKHKTLFIVSSKSGTTAETAALNQHFWHWNEQKYGQHAGEYFTAITDEGSDLHKLATARYFREIFLNPDDIGGRYSALSLFGLVPASLLDINLSSLLDSAQTVLENKSEIATALGLGLFLGRNAQGGRDKLTLSFSPAVASLGAWIEQLVAESTGKQGKGIVPVVGERLLDAGNYPPDRMFVHSALAADNENNPDALSGLTRLDQAGHPVALLQLHDIYDLGREFMRWEIATAIAASVMGINPFDEPDVNATKRATIEILKQNSAAGAFSHKSWDDSMDAYQVFFDVIQPGDYVALLGYLPPDQTWLKQLQLLRDRLLMKLDIATCVSLGPRYLHSSGQLHKGGRRNGHFLLFTATGEQDLSIPGQSYGFAHLISAQAQGDLNVLTERGQHTLHLDMGGLEQARIRLRELIELLPELP